MSLYSDLSEVLTPYANKIKELNGSLEELEDLTYLKGTDVLADAVVTAGKYKGANGSESTSVQWEYYSLDVTPGDRYLLYTYYGRGAQMWIIFDSNGAQVSHNDVPIPDPINGGFCEDVVTIPENGAVLVLNNNKYKNTNGYLRDNIVKIEQVNTYRRLINSDDIEIDDTALKDYINERVINASGSYNPLFGKKLCCCGDSITFGAGIPDGGTGTINNPPIDVFKLLGNGNMTKETSNVRMTYGYQIAEHNNMTYYYDGVSGSTMSNAQSGFSLANGRYTNLPMDMDYLVIFFGWNDHVKSTLGTITDNTNDTFYGAFNVVMPYLINKHTNTKIVLFVPFGTDAGFRQAVRDMANKWGVACFDMMQAGTPLYYGKEDSVGVDASVVASNRAKYQAGGGGAHPNYEGYKQIADRLDHFLRGI